MRALISLFHPLNVPLPTSVVPLASNVVPPPSFPAPLVKEQFPLPARLPPLQNPYLGIVQPTLAPLVLHPHSAQNVLSSRYDHYEAAAPLPSIYDHFEAATSVARAQPSIEEPRVVRQTTLPRHADPYYPYRR